MTVAETPATEKKLPQENRLTAGGSTGSNPALDKELVDRLAHLAAAAQKKAYAPYSGFAVGAALLCADGTIYQGCNIENAAFGPSNCAERTAFFKAVSEGKRNFIAMAVCGGRPGEPAAVCPPCGVCRQVAEEFCRPDFVFVLTGPKEPQLLTLAELLPYSFSLSPEADQKDGGGV